MMLSPYLLKCGMLESVVWIVMSKFAMIEKSYCFCLWQDHHLHGKFLDRSYT